MASSNIKPGPTEQELIEYAKYTVKNMDKTVLGLRLKLMIPTEIKDFSDKVNNLNDKTLKERDLDYILIYYKRDKDYHDMIEKNSKSSKGTKRKHDPNKTETETETETEKKRLKEHTQKRLNEYAQKEKKAQKEAAEKVQIQGLIDTDIDLLNTFVSTVHTNILTEIDKNFTKDENSIILNISDDFKDKDLLDNLNFINNKMILYEIIFIKKLKQVEQHYAQKTAKLESEKKSSSIYNFQRFDEVKEKYMNELRFLTKLANFRNYSNNLKKYSIDATTKKPYITSQKYLEDIYGHINKQVFSLPINKHHTERLVIKTEPCINIFDMKIDKEFFKTEYKEKIDDNIKELKYAINTELFKIICNKKLSNIGSSIFDEIIDKFNILVDSNLNENIGKINKWFSSDPAYINKLKQTICRYTYDTTDKKYKDLDYQHVNAENKIQDDRKELFNKIQSKILNDILFALINIKEIIEDITQHIESNGIEYLLFCDTENIALINESNAKLSKNKIATMILKMIEEKYDSKKICPIFCTNDIWDDIRNPNSFKFNYNSIVGYLLSSKSKNNEVDDYYIILLIFCINFKLYYNKINKCVASKKIPIPMNLEDFNLTYLVHSYDQFAWARSFNLSTYNFIEIDPNFNIIRPEITDLRQASHRAKITLNNVCSGICNFGQYHSQLSRASSSGVSLSRPTPFLYGGSYSKKNNKSKSGFRKSRTQKSGFRKSRTQKSEFRKSRTQKSGFKK